MDRSTDRLLLPRISIAGAVRRAFFALPVIALLAGAAQANTVTFDYNTSALYDTTQDRTNNSTQISTYMTGQWGSTVGVSGAASSGNASGASGYNGDGHVVCDGSCSSHPSDTLSTEYGTPFIMNANGSSQIDMTFGGNVQITSLSFHFEIFPDGTANQPPDFTFTMNGGATESCTVYGLSPGQATSGTTACAKPGGGASDGGYAGGASSSTSNLDSPASPWWNPVEQSQQYLGTMTFNFASPVTLSSLSFIDWPAEIGMTDLAITTYTPPHPAPEPGALAILASGLLGLGWLRRHRKARAA